jgi:hypothetical protein
MRVLGWAARREAMTIQVRELCRHFGMRRELLQPALDLLVETGHLEPGQAKRNGGQHVVASYTVIGTTPDGINPTVRDPDDPDSY